MTPDDPHHGGHQPPQPATEEPLPTLLPNPTVTIYYDGLIYLAFNEARRLAQAAVHTEAEGHHLIVEVKLGDNTVLFPTEQLPWDPSHAAIKAGAPFWLYVDSGQSINESSASLHLSVADDPQSYNRILNFEQLYNRDLPLHSERFAEFNFPQGISYSASHADADLKTLNQGQSSDMAVFQRKIDVSTRGATDIDAVSSSQGRKFIVLANDMGANEFFRFELEPEKHYEIRIFNTPIDGHHVHSPEEHFLQFYELFDLLESEKKFLIEPANSELAASESTPNSPPCIGGRKTAGTGL